MAEAPPSAIMELDLPDGVRVESLGAFPAQVDHGRTIVSLGDLVSGQEVEVPMRVAFSFGEVGAVMPGVVGLTDPDGVLADASARLAWEYAPDAAIDAQPRDPDVDRTIASVFSARARQAAVDLNRRGDYLAARAALEATARKIRAYAGRDQALHAMAEGLMREGEGFERVMSERERKVAYAKSHYEMQSRLVTGQARRSNR